MSNYSKKEAEEWLREKYKIAMMIKDYKLAKEYFLKIREIEDALEWDVVTEKYLKVNVYIM